MATASPAQAADETHRLAQGSPDAGPVSPRALFIPFGPRLRKPFCGLRRMG